MEYFIVYENIVDGKIINKGTINFTSDRPISCFDDVLWMQNKLKEHKGFNGSILILDWKKYD